MADMKIFDMRLIIYIFLFSQLFNFLNIFAQKVKEDSSELDSLKWEKVEEKSKKSKKIIWESYKSDEIYFENKTKKESKTNKINTFRERRLNEFSKNSTEL